MNLETRVLERVSALRKKGSQNVQLAHSLNGRFLPLDGDALDAVLEGLVDGFDRSAVDYVLGFPEGGSVPSYAFARILRRPLLLSTRVALDLPGPTIQFREPQSAIGEMHYLYGLHPGDRIILVEDEVSTGGTIVHAVRALRTAGVEVAGVVTLLAVDDPAMWRRMDEERITLRVGFRVPASVTRGLSPSVDG